MRSGADGRYRVRRTVAKPLAPVRLEGVLGVSKKAFRHGVLLPDGNVLPWYGAPGSEFLEFWRKKQVEWSALLAERRRRGLPEVFCCPRCALRPACAALAAAPVGLRQAGRRQVGPCPEKGRTEKRRETRTASL